MNFDNIWLLRLSASFQFLILTIALFTFWGIIKLIFLSKKIEKLKARYFNYLVHNIIVVRIEYFRLMEDINFLNEFKEDMPQLISTFGEQVIQKDFQALKTAIIKKRKTIKKFILSLTILGISISLAIISFLLKDFVFYGNWFLIFLFFDIVFSIFALFFIKFILPVKP
ncbi:MAG: hypothetical protein WCX74_02685 [Candidatus Paceibacterota bacterium]